MTGDEPPSEGRTDKPGRDWSTLHLWQIQPVRDVLVVLVVLGVLWLGQTIAIVTVPVLLAVLFAYLFEPVIAWMMRKRGWTRRRAVTGVLVCAIVFVAVPITGGVVFGAVQSIGLISKSRLDVELVRASLDETLSDEQVASRREAVREQCGPAWLWIRDQVSQAEGGTLGWAFRTASQWVSENRDQVAAGATGASVGAAKGFVSVARSVAAFFGGLFALGFAAFLTAFFFYFTATGWVEVKDFALGLVPEKHREITTHLASEFDRVISAFVRGRLTIAFIQAFVFTIGFWAIGVPAAFVIGPVIAVLSIVPYLALVGVPVAVVLLWLEAHTGIRGHWLWVIGAPTVFYFVAQALDDYIWTPVIQGKETDMSTPMILFASLAGGVLFGVFGLLIAIPLAACLKIALKELFWPRFHAWARGEESDFLPL